MVTKSTYRETNPGPPDVKVKGRWIFGEYDGEYVGEFSNGLKHGTGIYTQADGFKYQGDYVSALFFSEAEEFHILNLQLLVDNLEHKYPQEWFYHNHALQSTSSDNNHHH